MIGRDVDGGWMGGEYLTVAAAGPTAAAAATIAKVFFMVMTCSMELCIQTRSEERRRY